MVEWSLTFYGWHKEQLDDKWIEIVKDTQCLEVTHKTGVNLLFVCQKNVETHSYFVISTNIQ